jgi:DNA polymerase II large subunit
MDSAKYFETLSKNFDEAYKIAVAARAKGMDPETTVEIKLAYDLGSRVEGIIGVAGLTELINGMAHDKTAEELAFQITKEICTNPKFEMELTKKMTLAVRVGLAVLTEGRVVAPTEGIQGIRILKNADGTNYISVLYAGPIRGAGGGGAALSVAIADCARRTMGIGSYKATQSEIERYLEEIMIYHSRIARLQYLPSEQDIKHILENCPVCVDGVPTEELEIAIHRNVKRIGADGKEELITNKIRGGIGLVICEGIAQKAKSVIKYAGGAGLSWDWLNEVIKVGKPAAAGAQKSDSKNTAVFLQELVAGRPILAYPDYPGAFRLRYGRSRFTGIAAKGFSPATMIALAEFIATGTQVKLEKPGKGCVASPVDSIEGPFVKLRDGSAMRISSAKKLREVQNEIKKIISVGDMLVTYGDFKKSNTPMLPTSYVEEYWELQLKAAGYQGVFPTDIGFAEALKLSSDYKVPMHPKYIYEYQDVGVEELTKFREGLGRATLEGSSDSIDNISAIVIEQGEAEKMRPIVERLCIPHIDSMGMIRIEGEDARSVLLSFGLLGPGQGREIIQNPIDALAFINQFSPFKIMRRSTRLGGRIGRPEKAKERLMKTTINVLFPVSDYGGKERNLSKAYTNSSRSFGSPKIDVELGRYRCSVGNELIYSFHCIKHNARANIERRCISCGNVTMFAEECPKCGGKISGWDRRGAPLVDIVNDAMNYLGIQTMPKLMKGVRGLSNREKSSEAIEKGMLRSIHGISIFKDGTARFDATDIPITHFYPSEMGVSVERLRGLGYDVDYKGNELVSDSQLIEIKHQDVILNRRGAEYLMRVSKFVDDLLKKFYKMEPFYNAEKIDDMIGHSVMTLSPHTSAGVLGRIVGFTDASVGFAHPYVICARRRNCDGDEDTTMLLLDALINFSKSYLPTTIGGTMDAPITVAAHIKPEDVDNEVHPMEVCTGYTLDFYDKTYLGLSPSEMKVETVSSRFGGAHDLDMINFTHMSGPTSIDDAPKRSMYTKLNNMDEKVRVQFKLMDMLESIDKADTAKKLIKSHFIPDLVGNLHSFSKQSFRCVTCNAKYRRVPIVGICTSCGGKIVLTISRGGIQKYMKMAITLAERYDLDTYMKQNLMLIRDEITATFGSIEEQGQPKEQLSLTKFM